MVLRTNTLKAQVKDLQKILEESRVETETLRWSPLALELPFSRNVFRVPAFKEGLFEVQDAASQMVSDLLGPQPGMRVIDACAGSGGKTLHLAAIMQNKGKIIALDNKEFKLQELKKRAKRAGATIIETREITSSKSIKRLYETADKLLIDAPCSGLGVLRRNPDAKWKLKEDEIIAMRQQQAELWDKYAPMTKKGGHMVYAVCSILPSEGEEQLDGFMKRNSGKWKVLAEKRYSPEIHQADGFYMCLLERLA
jgi:16S rRNA (cytosine967-C5)-methyltransferase